IVLERHGFVFTGNGTSTSGPLTLADATPLPPGYRLAYTLNGEGPFELSVPLPTPPAGVLLSHALNAIIADVTNAVNAAHTPGITGAIAGTNRLQFTAATDTTHLSERSSIHFLDASTNSVAARLHLG